MSHRWTSSFDNHLGNCLVIFKNVKLRFTMRRMCFQEPDPHSTNQPLWSAFVLGLGVLFGFAPVSSELETTEFALPCVERNTSITKSHRSRASETSIRKPASKEKVSDSVEQCDTEVCFFAHPANRYKCATSKNVQNSSRRWFRIFKVSSNVRVLK